MVTLPRILRSGGEIRLKGYGGIDEVGGNCIVIEDRDRKIVLDNGVRFNILHSFYRGPFEPLGIAELQRIGAIPPPEVYIDMDALYISHLHLDHLGLLGALPPGSKVYVPCKHLLEALEEWYENSPTWLSYIPHRGNVEIVEMEPFKEDDNGVTPIPVSHSAYPTYALLYRGSETLFYSADLRIEALSPIFDTLGNIETALDGGGVDIALIEGTNIGRPLTPIGPQEFRSILEKLLREDGLRIITVDPLDYELFTLIYESAQATGRIIVVASERLLKTLPIWLDTTNHSIDMSNIRAPMELGAISRFEIINVEAEVYREPRNYLLIQDPISFTEQLRRKMLWGEEPPRDSTVILTNPEPLESETSLEEEILLRWLNTLGITTYRLRLSGHYYPHQLGTLIKTLKPRETIPIHTRSPKHLLKLVT